MPKKIKVTKIQIGHEKERSYNDFTTNREFEMRAGEAGEPEPIEDPILENAKETGGIGWTEEGAEQTVDFVYDRDFDSDSPRYVTDGDQNYWRMVDAENEADLYGTVMVYPDGHTVVLDETNTSTYHEEDQFWIYQSNSTISVDFPIVSGLYFDMYGIPYHNKTYTCKYTSRLVHKINDTYVDSSGHGGSDWPDGMPFPSPGGYGYMGISENSTIFYGQFDTPHEYVTAACEIIPNQSYSVLVSAALLPEDPDEDPVYYDKDYTILSDEDCNLISEDEKFKFLVDSAHPHYEVILDCGETEYTSYSVGIEGPTPMAVPIETQYSPGSGLNEVSTLSSMSDISLSNVGNTFNGMSYATALNGTYIDKHGNSVSKLAKMIDDGYNIRFQCKITNSAGKRARFIASNWFSEWNGDGEKVYRVCGITTPMDSTNDIYAIVIEIPTTLPSNGMFEGTFVSATKLT